MKRLLIIICLLFLLIASLFIDTFTVRRRSIEAKKHLNSIYELEVAYKFIFGHYTGNIDAICFQKEILVTDGGQAIYDVLLHSSADSTFTAIAVSVIDFDQDGQFNTWMVDEKGIITEIIKD